VILLLPCSRPPKQEGRGSVLAVGDGGGSRNPNKWANFFSPLSFSSSSFSFSSFSPSSMAEKCRGGGSMGSVGVGGEGGAPAPE